MRKSALLLGIFALLATGLFAQTAKNTRTTYNKIANIDAVSIRIEGQVKNIAEVMELYLENATGTKQKRSKGHSLLPGTRLRQVSDRVLDIYYTVEKVGTKDRPAGEIILFMALGNETFLAQDRYPEEFDRAKDLLNSMPLEVRIFELDLAIEDQEKVMDKAYKQYENLGSDSVKLEQTLIETQAAIEQNIVDRANQRATIADEAARLAEFRAMLEQEKRRALAPKEEMLNTKSIEEAEEDDDNE